MAEHHRRPRTGDRHAGKSVIVRASAELVEAATAAVAELDWTRTRYLIECLRYLVGERKTFPPRPAWAEEKAADLPAEDDGKAPEPEEETKERPPSDG